MRTRFFDQLQELGRELILMGSMIERAFLQAEDLLDSRDAALARTLIEGDVQVDRKEREIEALCLRIIVMQQPVARDLRQITAALKMITDMERIGDQAADIAEILTMPVSGALLPFPPHLKQMAQETGRMLNRAIDAYVRRDLQLALQVMADDDIVDALFVQVKQEIISLLHQARSQGLEADGMQLLDMLMIAKYFERSADHAVNIAEWVEYALTGQYKGEALQ